MGDKEIEEAVEGVMNRVLDKRRGEDLDHKSHHAFIEEMIRKETRKQEMWEKIKAQVLGWGIVAIVGALGTFLIKHLMEK